MSDTGATDERRSELVKLFILSETTSPVRLEAATGVKANTLCCLLSVLKWPIFYCSAMVVDRHCG